MLASVVSAGVVSAIVSGGVSVWNARNDIEQKNTALILQANDQRLKDDPARAAVYAALMVDGRLISPTIGCNLVGLALFTGNATPATFAGVLTALPARLVDSNFSTAPCNLKAFAETPEPTKPPDNIPMQVLCPVGTLYTQFGSQDQRDFGRKLKSVLSSSNPGAVVTAPQVIDKFDSKNPVVRYFFDGQEENARRWQALLEASLVGTDVKYAFVPGYEAAIGSDKQTTFELWWPASLKPVEVRTASCVSPPTI